jgi:hypothetical protein
MATDKPTLAYLPVLETGRQSDALRAALNLPENQHPAIQAFLQKGLDWALKDEAASEKLKQAAAVRKARKGVAK